MGRFAFVRLGLLLVALPLSATGAPKSCSSSWFTYKKSCYKIFLKAKTWHYAEKFCRAQKRGCHLASIHDAAESDSLAKYLSPRLSMINIWIGLRASKKQRVWQWSDGSRTNYTPWNEGEPNNVRRNEYCTELWAWPRYLYWNDNNCKKRRPFLCKCPL